ncbi:MAG: hypothetical protein ACK4TL_08080 [Hyphomicrobiaceae bacterium]
MLAAEAPPAAALHRREIILWLAGALLCLQLFAVPADTLEAYAGGLQELLASKSVIYYLAWYVILRLVADSSMTAPARAGDIALTLAVIASGFLMARSAHWIAVTASALYLMGRDRHDVTLAAAGAVLLALAFNGFWGPQLFELFAYHLLQADAALVGAALSATRSGIVWSETIVGTASGHSIIVYGPCSSFHNISLGLLCWVALTKLARPRWAARDLWIGLAVCAAVVALNASRLYLMALSAEGYAYWHVDTGQQLFAWATTLTVLAISLFGALRVGRKP